MQRKSSKPKSDDDAVEGSKKPRRRKGEGGGGRCPFNRQSAIENLRDQALLQVLDIEELSAHGKKINACPYYASRQAAADAQIIGKQ